MRRVLRACKFVSIPSHVPHDVFRGAGIGALALRVWNIRSSRRGRDITTLLMLVDYVPLLRVRCGRGVGRGGVLFDGDVDVAWLMRRRFVGGADHMKLHLACIGCGKIVWQSVLWEGVAAHECAMLCLGFHSELVVENTDAYVGEFYGRGVLAATVLMHLEA